MIARLVAPAAGERVLDLCAGIGGKATHLAEIMGNRGAGLRPWTSARASWPL